MIDDRLKFIEHSFTYHAPNQEQIERHKKIRDGFKELGVLIVQNTIESREQEIALMFLQTANTWCNTCIAINEADYE